MLVWPQMQESDPLQLNESDIRLIQNDYSTTRKYIHRLLEGGVRPEHLGTVLDARDDLREELFRIHPRRGTESKTIVCVSTSTLLRAYHLFLPSLTDDTNLFTDAIFLAGEVKREITHPYPNVFTLALERVIARYEELGDNIFSMEPSEFLS